MLDSSISDNTVGVSQSGMDALYDTIHTSLVTDAINKLQELDSVKSALKDAWSGEDCDIFISNLQKLEKNIEEKLIAYDRAIANEFTNVNAQWSEFQKRNVTSA